MTAARVDTSAPPTSHKEIPNPRPSFESFYKMGVLFMGPYMRDLIISGPY